jgi:hypothetical protein
MSHIHVPAAARVYRQPYPHEKGENRAYSRANQEAPPSESFWHQSQTLTVPFFTAVQQFELLIQLLAFKNELLG